MTLESNRQPPTGSEEPLYIAHRGIWTRLFALVMVVGLFWLLTARDAASGDLVFVAAWNRFGWVERAGIVLLFIVIPGFVLESLFTATVFRRNEIAVRDMFGRWRIYQYSDVERVEVVPRETVAIRFAQKRTLTVARSAADLERVVTILKERTTGLF
jgi:hypothetical protein